MNEDDIESKPGTSESTGLVGRGRKQDNDKDDDQPNASDREDTKRLDQDKINIQRLFSFFLIRKVRKVKIQCTIRRNVL